MKPNSDAVQHYAVKYTVRKMQADFSVASLESAVMDLYRVAGSGQVPGICAPCVFGHLPLALPSELLTIRSALLTKSEEDRKALKERATLYSEETLPFRNGRIRHCTAACPFVTRGECLLGQAKPFSCRLGSDAANDDNVKAVYAGHMIGLRLCGLDHTRLEAGLVIQRVLNDPSWPERYLKGERLFWDAALIQPGPDSIIESVKAITGKPEASGFGLNETVAAEFQQKMQQNGFEAAVPLLRGNGPLEQFLRIQVPWAYESEDEIMHWRTHFVSTMREVASMKFDPAEAFAAIKGRSTYALAYQGLDVKDILVEHARTIIEPTIARALPDLVQPIESKRRAGPIRVGYLSKYFRSSSATRWSFGWIKNHGPEIESFVFATNDYEDDWSLRFRRAADHYYFVPGDIAATARFIKSLDLDVLIFTDIGQLALNYMYAGMRLARVQCTAWGFPVTSGLSTIDYYLSSELMEGPGATDHYSEMLVKLPGSGLCYPQPEVEPPKLNRADTSLPGGTLIGFLQSPMKCLPRWDSLFAEVSQTIGAPIVFAEHEHPAVTRKTQKRMARAGIESVWIPRENADAFHQTMYLFDVLLDAPAWSGGITTLESIARRKPVVTLPTEFMRGRLSVAFMKQAGMDSLIADSPEQYVALVKDRELQRQVMENADIGAPFDDMTASAAINEWLLATSS